MHFRSGLLKKWLMVRKYHDELEALELIMDADDPFLLKDLCRVFQVDADNFLIAEALLSALQVESHLCQKEFNSEINDMKIMQDKAADDSFSMAHEVDLLITRQEAPDNKNIEQKTLKEIFKNNEEKINSRRESGFGNVDGAFCGWELNKKEIKNKIKNAIRSYANTSADKVIVVVDGTIFGSADEGILVTENEIFIKTFLKNKFAAKISGINKIAHDIENKAIIINGFSVEYLHSELSGSVDVIVSCLNEYISQ